MAGVVLRYCRVELRAGGIETLFPDGPRSANWPPDDAGFRQCARGCGFGDDALRYLRDHDLAHSFLAEFMFGTVSPTLYAAAIGERRHDHRGLDRRGNLFEERMVWHWQRYANGISNVSELEWKDWIAIYIDYRKRLLDGV